MSVRSRQIIFLFLAAFFLISAPLIMIYAVGYRYNLTKKKLELTGALVLDSEPERARILINGVDAHKITPARFPRLLPDDYRVRMEKENYHAWEKTLTVTSKHTTFATDVLFFHSSAPENVSGEEIKKIRPAAPKTSDTYSYSGYLYSLTATSADTKLVRVAKGGPREEIAILKNGHYKFIPSPDDLLTLLDGERARLYVINPRLRDPIVLEERATLGEWSPSGKKLLLSDDFELHVYEPEKNEILFITRYGNMIKKALWLESEAHAILSFDNQLVGLELYSHGERYSPTLLEMKKISDLFLNNDMDTAYFLSETENEKKWFKLPIL